MEADHFHLVFSDINNCPEKTEHDQGHQAKATTDFSVDAWVIGVA
jgi:hypothetical protein